jgi:hypothetical protein
VIALGDLLYRIALPFSYEFYFDKPIGACLLKIFHHFIQEPLTRNQIDVSLFRFLKRLKSFFSASYFPLDELCDVISLLIYISFEENLSHTASIPLPDGAPDVSLAPLPAADAPLPAADAPLPAADADADPPASTGPSVANVSDISCSDYKSLLMDLEIIPALLTIEYRFSKVISEFVDIIELCIAHEDEVFLDYLVASGVLSFILSKDPKIDDQVIEVTKLMTSFNGKYFEMIETLAMELRFSEEVLTFLRPEPAMAPRR